MTTAEHIVEVAKLCSIQGCGEKLRCNGLCNKHRQSAWTKANPEKRRAQNARYKSKDVEKHSKYNKEWFSKNKGKATAYAVKRYAAIRNRTPAWVTDDDRWIIEQSYELADLRTRMFGFKWHVDHIIPLHGRNVSGFHVPDNLQVIPGAENCRKGNRFSIQ
jgi:hypothetical protein